MSRKPHRFGLKMVFAFMCLVGGLSLLFFACMPLLFSFEEMSWQDWWGGAILILSGGLLIARAAVTVRPFIRFTQPPNKKR